MSEDAVHQLRVSTRRLLSAVSLLECLGAAKAEDAANVQRVLKKRLKALGDIRDTHVLRMHIEEKLSFFPELATVKRKLAKRERKLIEAAAPEVRHWGTGKLEKHIEIMRCNLAGAAKSARNAVTLRRSALKAITRAFNEVVAVRRRIDPQEPATVHRTRVSFKRFRYTAELVSPCVTGFNRKQLGRMARYQRRMGLIQDCEVLQEYIRHYVQEHGNAASALLNGFLIYLRRRRARLLRNFLLKADELYSFWGAER